MPSYKKCVVVDYGIGNVFSVCQAIKRIGGEPVLTGDAALIRAADHVILPGVGAFGRAAARLSDLGLDDTIKAYVETGRPFLGICVGMQLLMTTGLEFGEHAGLDLLSGTVEKITAVDEDQQALRIPLIGWNTPVPPGGDVSRWQNTAFEERDPQNAYYFVHSFSVRPTNEADILAVVDAGQSKVVAAVGKDNIMGVQFHPERSAHSGGAFLDQFLSL